MLSSRADRDGTGPQTSDILNLAFHIFMGIVATLRFTRVLIVRSCKRLDKWFEDKFGKMWNRDDIDDEEPNSNNRAGIEVTIQDSATTMTSA
jgi:hypothetical protein